MEKNICRTASKSLLSQGKHEIFTPGNCADVTSHAKTFLTVSHFKTDSRSPAVHLPFKRTGMPFERLVLSVLKNSLSVRTVRAIRSRKLISSSNGSSYPFEKFISHSNGSSCPCKKETMSFFGSRSNKTRLQNNSPCFVK